MIPNLWCQTPIRGRQRSQMGLQGLLRFETSGNALIFILVLGLGGSFQNGFHTTGISSPSPYIQHFINSSWYERYGEHPPLQTVTIIWSAIVALYAVGGLVAALNVKNVTGMFGRKKAMIGNNLINIVAAVFMLMSKQANSFEMIMIARFLYGFGAGLGTIIHTIYLGESSPKNIRGMVTVTCIIFSTFGKLSGRIFGLSEILGREETWTILLSVPTCFAVVQLLVLPFFPEAPRYSLIDKGDVDACKKALQFLWGSKDEYKVEIDEMKAEQKAIKGVQNKTLMELIRDRSIRWQLITMAVITVGIQFSGISAINIFSYNIFLEAGIPKGNIRYVMLGLGVVDVLTSLFSSLLIEHTGRRPLLWGGFGAMSALLVLITVTLNLKDVGQWVPYTTAGLFMLFNLSFVGGPSGISITLANEVFIQSCRPAAFSFIGIQRRLVQAVLGLSFPFLIQYLPSFSFVLFACVCLVAFLYTFFFVPETKGKTLLEISEQFKSINVCGKSFSQDQTLETMETKL